MKRLLVISYWLLVIGVTPVCAYAFEPAVEYEKANNLYQKNSFDSAAKIYEQLIKEEYIEAEVYFNLGNCYYKTNKNAQAILNYERALKLKPNDEDILFNLKIAQLKTVDKIETVPEIFYLRWTKKLVAIFSTDGWARAIVTCIWLMFLFAAIYAVSIVFALKRSAFIFTIIFLFLTFLTGFLAHQNFVSNTENKNAIVISVSSYVKSSPGENNTDLFLLHEGTKVSMQDEFENWVKIKIANGSVGWVKKSDVEVI